MNRIYILILCALIFGMAAPAGAFQGFVQEDGNATISWGDGVITAVAPVTATGDGLDPAYDKAISLRRAAVAARRGLLEMLADVRIMGNTTVALLMDEDPVVAGKVRRLVHNSRFDRPEGVAGNGTIRAYESLRGQLLGLLLPKTVQFQTGVPLKVRNASTRNVDPGTDTDATSGTVTPTDAMAASGTFTGLVIDARGFPVIPSLVPVVFGADGLGVYGPFSVSRASALAHGLAAYSVTDDKAVIGERVGDNPLLVKVVRLVTHRTHFVISVPAANLARTLANDSLIADGCKVVILMDGPKKDEE